MMARRIMAGRRRAAGGGGLWSPAQIETELWLDASDNSTVTESGGLVSVLADKSGNGRNATQAVADSMPSIVVGQNDLTVLDFYGCRFLSCGDVIDIGTGNLCVYVVGLSESNDANHTFVAKSVATSAPNRWGVIRLNKTLYAYLNENGVDKGAEADYLTTTNHGILGQVIERGAYNSLYINGTMAAQVSGVSTVDTQSTFRLLVGAYGNATDTGETFCMEGQIAEVVINRDPSTRQLIEGYLAHKWGLTASLIVGHPYESIAP